MMVFIIVLSDFYLILIQFLVLLNPSKQDREPLSALALDCLCPARPIPCSCYPFQNSTRNPSLLPIWRGPLSPSGQVVLYIYKATTHNPVLVNHELFYESPWLPIPSNINQDVRLWVSKLIKALPCISKFPAAIRLRSITLNLTWLSS